MGLFDKIRSMVNGDDANNAYEDEDMGATYDDSAVPARPVNRGMSINAASIELKVVRPDTFINETDRRSSSQQSHGSAQS